jgi:putative ABC transport system permease protein
MIGLTKIAFRNVFRNFSRSILTIFITAMSVTILVVGSSFVDGAINSFLNENIKSTGHVRIASSNYDIYSKMLSLTHNVANYDQIERAVTNQPDVKAKLKIVTGVIKFGAVVYNGEANQESLGFGIEPNYYETLGINRAIYQGRIVNPTAGDEIIIGRRLADSLKIKINQQVTLLTRTQFNATSVSNYQVVGIYDIQNSKLNRSFYLPLHSAQMLLDMEGIVSEVLVFGKSIPDTTLLRNKLLKIPALQKLELKPWNLIGTAASFLILVNIIIYTILVIIVILAGLGITNTMLMVMLERRKEMGLLKSMGMHEREIVILFTIEGIILGLTGMVIGLLLGGSAAYNLSVQGVHFGSALQGVSFATTEVVYGTFNSAIFVRAVVLSVVSGVLASLIPSMLGVRVQSAVALKG